jgi:glycosyltransferase involved in cell wall biosynthesis
MAQRPFVSVLTPTYNRRLFIPTAIACFKAQTYPQDRMEWIILDDGSDPVEDLFKASGLRNVRYYREEKKLPIGAKRNKINELAKGDICVAWDDDDYYPADRIRYSVMRLQGAPATYRAPVVGASQLFLYFTDRNEIWSIGPYNQQHCTNGTMAYWRSYFKDHRYDDTAEKAEEKKFMDDWKTQVIQLRPELTMLVICHAYNTFDKRRLFGQTNPTFKKQSIKLKDIVKDKKTRDFYLSLAAAYKDKPLPDLTTPLPTGVPELGPAPSEFTGPTPAELPTLEVSEKEESPVQTPTPPDQESLQVDVRV